MKNIYRTSTGIEIGCMYVKPLRQLNQDEEVIQRALLGVRRTNPLAPVLYALFLCGVTAVLSMIIGSGR